LKSESRGAQSKTLSNGWYAFMGIGMGLISLIILMVIAYIVYNLIKNEKILAPAKARRIFG
jgi:hypothetical protein